MHQKTHLMVSRWVGVLCWDRALCRHLYGDDHHQLLATTVFLRLIECAVVTEDARPVNPSVDSAVVGDVLVPLGRDPGQVVGVPTLTGPGTPNQVNTTIFIGDSDD